MLEPTLLEPQVAAEAVDAGQAGLADHWQAELRACLQRLYGDTPQMAEGLRQIQALVRGSAMQHPAAPRGIDQSDAMLIAYPDHVTGGGGSGALRTLAAFCERHLPRSFSAIHVLPFFESDGDFGYAVVDPTSVSPAHGSDSDVADLARRFGLCSDLILHHVSARHGWVKAFLAGDDRLARRFVHAAPGLDDGMAAPWLRYTRFRRADGTEVALRTRYGPDQVDLNYREPSVLVEALRILLWQVALGARWIRLDAVAFIWKQPGTDGSHRPEVGTILRVLRLVLDIVAPSVRLIAEVDHETRSATYLDTGARTVDAVYDFALPALLAHSFVSGRCDELAAYLRRRPPLRPGTTCINAASTHDGLFLRPYAPVLSASAQAELLQRAAARGGTVRHGRFGEGQAPYECNIALAALLGQQADTAAVAARRMACLLSIVLSLPGTPALYLNVLLLADNDHALVERTGDARAINRRTFTAAELDRMLADDTSPALLLPRVRQLLDTRTRHHAFSPAARCELLPAQSPATLAFWRGEGEVLCLANVGAGAVPYHLPPGAFEDLLTGHRHKGDLLLEPHEYLWLRPCDIAANTRPPAAPIIDYVEELREFYARRAWRPAPDEGLRLDESYRRNHLPLVAPAHADVIAQCPETDYRDGRYRAGRVSLVAFLPDQCFDTPVFHEWLHEVRRSCFAHKIAWRTHARRQHRLHATICGRLNLRHDEAAIDAAMARVSQLPTFHVRAIGPWLGASRNNGRLYVPLLPQRPCTGPSHPLRALQEAADHETSDLFVLGLLQFTDHLNACEAHALAALLARFESRTLFECRVDEVALIATHDDLILDSRVLRRIALAAPASGRPAQDESL